VKPAPSTHYFKSQESDPDRHGLIKVFSGGSTGEPKSILRPLSTWQKSAQLEAQVFGLLPSDRFAVLGSPSHSLWAYAHFRAGLIGSLCRGCTALSATDVEGLIHHRPTVIYGVPEMALALSRFLTRANQVLGSVRLLLLGGGPWPAVASPEALRSSFPNAQLMTFYGSAEASFIAFGEPKKPLQAFPGVEVNIRADGAIWVRSPLTFLPGDWIDTADLGRWLGHDRFEVLGRADRQLQVKGTKWAVEPLERALSQTLGLGRLALLQDSNRHVVCVIDGVDEDPPLGPSLPELNNSLRQQFAKSPLIRRVHLVQAGHWPTTAAGKTDWSALRAVINQSNSP
jgi:long-chain acyl-CoA synthetase